MDDQRQRDASIDSAQPRIVLQGLDHTPPEFVNFVQASYDAATFRIAFCRYLPPLSLRPEDLDDFQKKVQSEGFHFDVVSQLIVAPSVLRSMITALAQQLDYYEQQFGEHAVPQAGKPGLGEAENDSQ